MTALLEAIVTWVTKNSWRGLFGVFVASGSVLLFARQLGIVAWANPLRAYLVCICLLSGSVLLTHVGSGLWTEVRKHQSDGRDLRIVTGNPVYSTWSIGSGPHKRPILVLMCRLSFAHTENVAMVLRKAFLKGTTQVVPMNDLVVEGAYDPPEHICIHLSPVVSKPGRTLSGKLVFVDQFNKRHVSEKIDFSPNVLPVASFEKLLVSNPNCFFCNQPVTLQDQAKEAQIPAHLKCVWP
jgi:hypothetical protein